MFSGSFPCLNLFLLNPRYYTSSWAAVSKLCILTFQRPQSLKSSNLRYNENIVRRQKTLNYFQIYLDKHSYTDSDCSFSFWHLCDWLKEDLTQCYTYCGMKHGVSYSSSEVWRYVRTIVGISLWHQITWTYKSIPVSWIMSDRMMTATLSRSVERFRSFTTNNKIIPKIFETRQTWAWSLMSRSSYLNRRFTIKPLKAAAKR